MVFCWKDARERAIRTKLSRSEKNDLFETFEVGWSFSIKNIAFSWKDARERAIRTKLSRSKKPAFSTILKMKFFLKKVLLFLEKMQENEQIIQIEQFKKKEDFFDTFEVRWSFLSIKSICFSWKDARERAICTKLRRSKKPAFSTILKHDSYFVKKL